MNVESLIVSLGNPGRYHWIILPLFSLSWLTVVFNNVVMTFYGFAPVMAARCTSAVPFNASVANFTEASQNVTSCRGGECSSAGCILEYDKPDALSTIATEWQLVGDRKWMGSFATTLYFAGVMVGGLLMGTLADRFGRKKILLVCLVMPVPLGVAVAFMPYYEGFVILRFLLGILVQGLSSVGFVHCVEFFAAKHKLRVIVGFEFVWTMGMMLLALLAYLLQDWRQLQLAVALIPALCIAYAWWLPESPRWLAVRGRYEEVAAIFVRAAGINGIAVESDKLLPPPPADAVAAKLEHKLGRQQNYTAFDMLKTPQLRRRSLILFYIWFSVAVGYYGLTFGMRPLLANRYLSFFMNAACECVALVINGLLVSRIGRKIPLLVSMVSGGVICIASGVIASQVAGNVAAQAAAITALIGRTFITVCYQTLFVWTSELFPTVIRSVSVGACSFWTRVGSLLAPQLVLLGQYTWKDLPILIIGIVCLIGGGLVFLLSETKDTKLPDSIEEIERSHHLQLCACRGKSKEKKMADASDDHDIQQSGV